MPEAPVTGIILAGGRAAAWAETRRRCRGRRRRRAPLRRQLAPHPRYSPSPPAGWRTVCAEVVLVGYRAERYPLPYRTVPDVYPDSGSLGGIYSGLAAAGRWSFAIAADMPFLNLALVRHMLSLPREWDALVPVIAGRPEPLHALYGPVCLPGYARAD